MPYLDPPRRLCIPGRDVAQDGVGKEGGRAIAEHRRKLTDKEET